MAFGLVMIWARSLVDKLIASIMRRHCVHATELAVVVHGMPAASRRMHQVPGHADFCRFRLGGLEDFGDGTVVKATETDGGLSFLIVFLMYSCSAEFILSCSERAFV